MVSCLYSKKSKENYFAPISEYSIVFVALNQGEILLNVSLVKLQNNDHCHKSGIVDMVTVQDLTFIQVTSIYFLGCFCNR